MLLKLAKLGDKIISPIYLGATRIWRYIIEELLSGTSIETSEKTIAADDIVLLKVEGRYSQDDTPTPEYPAEITTVGNPVIDVNGTEYEITVPSNMASLPNGTHDSVKGTTSIKRIGKVTLDGSEEWTWWKDGNQATNTPTFRVGWKSSNVDVEITSEGYLQTTMSGSLGRSWHTSWWDTSTNHNEIIRYGIGNGDTCTIMLEVRSTNGGTSIPEFYVGASYGYKSMTGTISSEWSWIYLTFTNDQSATNPHIGWYADSLGEIYQVRKYVIIYGEVPQNTNDYYLLNESKNLFDKDNANILNAYISSTIINAATTRTLYIPCLPNTTYTVSKRGSVRFSWGETVLTPADGVAVQNLISYTSATRISRTTLSDSNFLCIYYWLDGDTNTLTEQEVLDTIQIEYGNKKTKYLPYGYSLGITPNTADDIRVISNKIKSVKPSELEEETEAMCINEDGDLVVKTNRADDVADFKTWLGTNNLTTYYETTEQEHEVTVPEISLQAGENNITTTNAVKPNLEITYRREY